MDELFAARENWPAWTGMLHFAPSVLRLDPGIVVVNVDLTIQLEQLAFQVGGG